MNSAKIGNNSPQHRLECEARHVMKYDRSGREDYYKKVLPLRGQKTVNELVAEVNRQRKIREEQTSEMEM